MGGEYSPQSSDGDATAGDIVNYTFAIKNTGSVTLSTIDLVSPTVSANPAEAPVHVLRFEHAR